MSQLTASTIKAKDLVKTYRLVAESRPFFLRSENGFNAIDKISFDVKKGERVGIVGENGSGKTTLLKIIAGITELTSGQLETNGRIVSIIDLEAGFHPDLTGKENILINGAIIGMVRAEVEARLNQIIEFADIGRFIHEPLRTYSSGMKLRLGFSIAVHSNFNTLVLDEGVAFGDEGFRLKIIE
ncbi:MAG: ATP-binding cassette domain-containing protein, partial [Patescibacteria group bacterium]|nr:ATP-binding cassette domain-containing protein [Patescibacteria group bacterium]